MSIFSEFGRRRREKRDIAHLLELEDRLLVDIGIRRSDLLRRRATAA